MPKVEIYTQPWCPYCTRARALLERKGVAFTEIEAPHGTAARAESIRRAARMERVRGVDMETHAAVARDGWRDVPVISWLRAAADRQRLAVSGTDRPTPADALRPCYKCANEQAANPAFYETCGGWPGKSRHRTRQAPPRRPPQEGRRHPPMAR